MVPDVESCGARVCRPLARRCASGARLLLPLVDRLEEGVPAPRLPSGACASDRGGDRGRRAETAALRRLAGTSGARSPSPGRWQLRHARERFLAATATFKASFEAFACALAEHERVPMPFERARTLLALERRSDARRPAESRASLQQALRIFQEPRTPVWAEKARAELGRTGGRAREKGLTPAESRVAALVAEGRTNREVAAALFLGERTVETHLTHIYAKLGVRSRTEFRPPAAVKIRTGRGKVQGFSRFQGASSPSLGCVPSYLAETFLARGDAGERAARAEGALGRRGADAGGDARPLRVLDPRPRGRDLLLHLRRAVGPEVALAARLAGLEPLRVVEAVSSGKE